MAFQNVLLPVSPPSAYTEPPNVMINWVAWRLLRGRSLIRFSSITAATDVSLVSTMLAVALTSTRSEAEPICMVTLTSMLLLTMSTRPD